jgi:hypothetical protein
MNFTKAERISLKRHDTLNENWVQSLIAADPTILGLGELVLRDRERIQPKAGRLDLLLQNPETKRRYEVEIQLGATDETHIIRTIEYWAVRPVASRLGLRSSTARRGTPPRKSNATAKTVEGNLGGFCV